MYELGFFKVVRELSNVMKTNKKIVSCPATHVVLRDHKISGHAKDYVRW